MDDYLGVLYIELLQKSLNRCIIDWKCFTDRIVMESNKSHLRIALIQYCRGQRDIFLKLKVLFDLTKYQKTIDKLLQYSTQYDQYISNAVQDLSRNIISIQSNILPSPNVSLGVDILNSFTYSKMPIMIADVSKSSVDNTIPIIKLNPEDVDLCLNRLKIHFYVQFKLSRCRRSCKIDFVNGVCHFKRDHFFHMELLYDFNQYQVTKFKMALNDNYVNNVINILNYILNYNLMPGSKDLYSPKDNDELGDHKQKDNNIFDLIYKIVNNYIGKLIMKYLYKQAINYSNAKFTVYNYTLESESSETEREKLLVEGYPKYKNEGNNGLVLRFVRLQNGDVSLKVEELNLNYDNIHNYHLDHWLKEVSDQLESHQLKVLKEIQTSLKEEEKKVLQSANKLLSVEFKKAREGTGYRFLETYESSLEELYLTDLSKEATKTGKRVKGASKREDSSSEGKEWEFKFWINKINGSINLEGHHTEFNLNESRLIMKLNRIVGLLEKKFVKMDPFPVECVDVGHLILESQFAEFPTDLKNRITKEQNIDTNLLSLFLGENKYILEDFQDNFKLIAFYNAFPPGNRRLDTKTSSVGKISNSTRSNGGTLRLNGPLDDSTSAIKVNVHNETRYQVNSQNPLKLVLAVFVYECIIVNNTMLALDEYNGLLGILELSRKYDPSLVDAVRPTLDTLLKLDVFNRADELSKSNSFFKAHFLNKGSQDMQFLFKNFDLTLVLNDQGSFKQVVSNNQHLNFKSQQEALAKVNSLINSQMEDFK